MYVVIHNLTVSLTHTEFKGHVRGPGKSQNSLLRKALMLYPQVCAQIPQHLSELPLSSEALPVTIRGNADWCGRPHGDQIKSQ